MPENSNWPAWMLGGVKSCKKGHSWYGAATSCRQCEAGDEPKRGPGDKVLSWDEMNRISWRQSLIPGSERASR